MFACPPPPGFRVYRLSAHASAQASRLGLTESEVIAMARSAARCTHEHGNWRYSNFILLIENEVIEHIAPFRPKRKKRFDAPIGSRTITLQAPGNSAKV